MWIFSAIANAVGKNFIGTPNYLFGLLFNRVKADGGVTEAQQCTIEELTELQNDNLLSSASLVLTPSSYKEGALYSVIPSTGAGDMSVTRATTATRVNSAGFVELVPYNLFVYSQDFTNPNWQKLNSSTITANTTTAPDGTLTASTYKASNQAYGRILRQGFLNYTLGNYTLSVYVKKSNYSRVGLRIAFSTAPTDRYPFYNFDDDTLNTLGISGVSMSRQLLDNGWVRINLTYNLTAITTSTDIALVGADGGTAAALTGNEQVFVWGAQLNQGTLLPYQSTVTRLNIPRLDYSLGGCPSILLEPQRTNIIARSEEFNTWLLYQFSSIATNTTTAPNGTLTADTLISGVSVGRQEVYRSPNSAFVNGTAYSVSVYAKTNGKTWLYLGTDANQAVYFNVVNGTVGNASPGFTGSIVSVGNGWYRCIINFVFGTGATPNQIIIGNATTNGTPSDSGNGVLGNYIWGAQVEVGSYATSYIPTTSASVTRNADVISKTGITSLLNPSEGVFYLEATELRDTTQKTMQLSNGSDLNNVTITFVNNSIVLETVGGGATYRTNFVSSNLYSTNKIAISWKSGNIFSYINGTRYNLSIVSGAGNGIPIVLDRLTFSYWWSGNPFYSNVKSLSIWKTQLTDSELAQLTTI